LAPKYEPSCLFSNIYIKTPTFLLIYTTIIANF
jgi:hypothetical protein